MDDGVVRLPMKLMHNYAVDQVLCCGFRRRDPSMIDGGQFDFPPDCMYLSSVVP